MTEAKYEPMFPMAEGNLWRTQHETLVDLLAFVDEHAPNEPVPLPVVDWRIGAFHTVSAEAISSATDPRNIVETYAEALGTEMQTVELVGKTRYIATGHIGARQGTAQEPRTTLHISADVWDEDEVDEH